MSIVSRRSKKGFNWGNAQQMSKIDFEGMRKKKDIGLWTYPFISVIKPLMSSNDFIGWSCFMVSVKRMLIF